MTEAELAEIERECEKHPREQDWKWMSEQLGRVCAYVRELQADSPCDVCPCYDARVMSRESRV